jgi:hypothetical protein
MRCRWKNRRSEPSVVASPCASATRATISSKVRSGSTATSARSQSACGSNGERLRPPRGNGLTLPVSACRLAQRTAEDTPTRNRAAAARRELPPDTSATTRVRRSSECVPMPASRPTDSIESDQRAQSQMGQRPQLDFACVGPGVERQLSDSAGGTQPERPFAMSGRRRAERKNPSPAMPVTESSPQAAESPRKSGVCCRSWAGMGRAKSS